MSRRTGLVAVVALAALTVSPSPAQVGVRDSQPLPASGKAGPATKPSVTLEHHIIQVEPMPRPKPAPRVRRALPPTRLAYNVSTHQQSLGARARRVVLGDGRFRPEPFPRLDR